MTSVGRSAKRHGTLRSRASLVEALQMRPFQRMRNSHGSTANTDSSMQERNRSLTGSLMQRRHSAVPRIRPLPKGDLRLRHSKRCTTTRTFVPMVRITVVRWPLRGPKGGQVGGVRLRQLFDSPTRPLDKVREFGGREEKVVEPISDNSLELDPHGELTR